MPDSGPSPPGQDPPLPEADQEIWQRAMTAGNAGDFVDAAVAVKDLLSRHPGHNGLLFAAMRISHNAYDSERAFRDALALAQASRTPEARHRAWEQLLFWAPFVGYLTDAQVADLAVQWAGYLATSMRGAPLPPPPPRTAEPRLKIGYMSPAFGFSADYLPLALHDRQVVSTIGYSTASAPMPASTMPPGFDLFRDLAGSSDAMAAARIRQDDIDILVDLGGTGDAQRNGILAYRPARLQVGWSNKLVPQFRPLLDWVLGEEALFAGGDFDHPGAALHFHLPQPLAIVAEARPAPPVAPAPILQAGHATIGSTASIYKITDTTLQFWSRILKLIPTARFVYSAPRLPDMTLQKLRDGFAANGIDPARLTFQVRLHTDFAKALNAVDLALDAFPFSSNFSCLQALRQGVPVVTCRGPRLPGRFSASLLATIGHGELVAETPERFVELAAALSGDAARLQHYRTVLPVAVKRARLDDLRFTAACLEQAYAAIWRSWRSSGP